MIPFFEQRVMRNLAGYPRAEKLAARLLGGLRRPVPLCPIVPDVTPVTTAEMSHTEETIVTESDSFLPLGDGPVFITSRFRTGSTLLWQAFDRLPGFTAYYEPLNERRWFDPAARGEQTDSSHRGTTAYHANYEGLESLGALYDDGWTYRKLAMGAGDRDEALVAYITQLIRAASGQAVLQFNRVDFRLPFLRKYFPEARILHLERASRDVWRSSLKGAANDPSWRLTNFEGLSHFYLLPWYRDLAISFPWMLQKGADTHPYFIHHLIWRLSGLFAQEWAHASIGYEALCDDFRGTLARLLGVTADDERLNALDGLMAPRAKGYDHGADAAFYEEQEAQVEALLAAHLPPKIQAV